jgi:5-methylcytosine-specific restriction endonuclease McrA
MALHPERNEYHKEYNKERHIQRRTKLINHLGGKCVNCNSTENLQFDHIDPSSKTFTIAQKWLTNWNNLLKEVSKCQLLCQTCHSNKTIKDLGNKPRQHGSDTMYRQGCRCIECKQAHSVVGKNYQPKRKSRRKII